MSVSGMMMAAAGTFAIKAADKALDKASEKLASSLSEYASVVRDKIVTDFRIGFQVFLQSSYEKCRTYKTLLNPYVPLPVLDKYINVYLEIGAKNFVDETVVDGIRPNTRLIVSGLAGGGKSMFMKYLTLKMSDAKAGLIPLFIELRRFNEEEFTTLKDLILSAVSTDATAVSVDQFDLALKAGVFALVLDGFDELNEGIADKIEKEIIKFEQFHPKTAIIVSSRPNHRFEAWERFYSAKVLPLKAPQTKKLIQSFDYDEGVKERFLERVESGLWDTHESFLSSPLLCTIMMLTFEEFAEIPTKMHSFYGQAFDTLFQRHDALKYQFTRETKTGLTKDLFKRCLSAFCVTSYLDQSYSMKDETANKYATASIKYVKQSTGQSLRGVKAEFLVSDLEKCVSVLQQDGLELTFIHRSFQEYFSALFLVNYHDDRLPDLLDRFSHRYGDSVISMAFDMAREKIEREWIEPRIIALLAKIKACKSLTEKAGLVYESFHMTRTPKYYYLFSEYNRENFGFIFCLCKLYIKNMSVSSWFKNLDTPLAHDFIEEVIPRDKAERGEPIAGWQNLVIEDDEDGINRYKTEFVNEIDKFLMHIGIGESFNRLEVEAPKIVASMARREKIRDGVIDKFLA